MPNPQEGTHYVEGVNYFVENMQLHSHVDRDGISKVELTALPGSDNAIPAANPTGILNATSIAVAGTATTMAGTYSRAVMAKYGRNVTVVLSGAGTPTVTVKGRDYLGQSMTEQFTGNGTTPVAGKKAFAYVDSVAYGAVAATTMNVGWGDVLGLPFAADQLEHEAVNDQATANAGTFVAAVKTAQTATSGDPRGTYTPHTNNATNGARKYTILTRNDKTKLHGVRHFAS